MGVTAFLLAELLGVCGMFRSPEVFVADRGVRALLSLCSFTDVIPLHSPDARLPSRSQICDSRHNSVENHCPDGPQLLKIGPLE